jgi:hypothetical protein
MKRGDIVYVKTKSVYGRLIRLFTGGDYTHTYIMFHQIPSNGKWIVLEASGLSVRLTWECKSVEKAVYRPSGNVGNALDGVLCHVGRPYGFLQILGYVWVSLVRHAFGKYVSNPFTDGVTCKELVSLYIKELGYQSFTDEEDPDITDPTAQAKNLDLHPDLFTRVD